MENRKVRIMLQVETDLNEMCEINNGEPLVTCADHHFIEYVWSRLTPGDVCQILKEGAPQLTVKDVQIKGV